MYIFSIAQWPPVRELRKAFAVVCATMTIGACGGAAYKSAQAPRDAAATAVGTSDVTARASTYTVFVGATFVAHLHRPASASSKKAPAVLLLGGSGGGIGWQDYMAERLAQRGMIGVAVAYFALDSLPKELDRIPLEAFDNALKWVNSQAGVDRTRIGVGGLSKGAEAALLFASAHSDLKAIAVFSPSAYVFQSVTRDFRKTSSWTRNGVDVPFIAYGNAPTGSALVEFYQRGVRDATAAVREAARIPVERIRAPLLMMSGNNDLLWGSSQFANEIAARLKESNRTAFENIIYENAGHIITPIRDDDVTFRGGTNEGNHAAQVDGQQRFLDFFVRQMVTR